MNGEGNSSLKDRLAANFKHSGTRIIFICGGLMIAVFAFFAFNGGKKAVTGNTQLVSVPSQAAGNRKTQADPEVNKLIEQADNRRFEDAQGKPDVSVLPSNAVGKPVQGMSGDRLLAGLDHHAQGDAEGRQAGPATANAPMTPDERAAASQREQAEKARHSRQVNNQEANMRVLLERWSSQGEFKIIQVAGKSAAGSTGGGLGDRTQSPEPDQMPATLFPAGHTLYARNVLYVNSDKPGTPVVAEIESSAFHGARLIGAFQTLDDQLMLRFNKMDYQGVDYQIDAVAIDPDANAPAFSDNSDPRYFSRFGLQLAAQFVAGLAKVAQQSGQTEIVSGSGTVTVAQQAASMRRALWGGAGAVGQQLSADIGQAAPKGPLVEIYANSGIGIMFLQSVHAPSSGSAVPSQKSVPAPMGGAVMPGQNSRQEPAPPASVMGTGIPITSLNGVQGLNLQSR